MTIHYSNTRNQHQDAASADPQIVKDHHDHQKKHQEIPGCGVGLGVGVDSGWGVAIREMQLGADLLGISRLRLGADWCLVCARDWYSKAPGALGRQSHQETPGEHQERTKAQHTTQRGHQERYVTHF